MNVPLYHRQSVRHPRRPCLAVYVSDSVSLALAMLSVCWMHIWRRAQGSRRYISLSPTTVAHAPNEHFLFTLAGKLGLSGWYNSVADILAERYDIKRARDLQRELAQVLDLGRHDNANNPPLRPIQARQELLDLE